MSHSTGGTPLKPVTHGVIKELLGRALTEADLRRRLEIDPKEALEHEGYEPSAHAVDFFRQAERHGLIRAADNVKSSNDDDPFRCGAYK